MKKDITYTVEREYKNLISKEELLRRIIKAHTDRQDVKNN